MATTRPAFGLAVMLAGMIAWGFLFTLLYGGASLICTPPVSATAMSIFRVVAGAMAAAAMLALIAGAFWLRRRQAIAPLQPSSPSQTFMINGTDALAVGAAIAIIWLTVPVVIFSDCRS